MDAYRRVDSGHRGRQPDHRRSSRPRSWTRRPSSARSSVIVLEDNSGQGVLPGAVLVKHILYSPNHDPSGASALKADDPAWAAAKAEAEDAYAKLKAGTATLRLPGRRRATTPGPAATNGFLPYFSQADTSTRSTRRSRPPSTPPGSQPGQLLEPVQSAFGWHVIEFVTADDPTTRATAARGRRRRRPAPTSRSSRRTTPSTRRPAKGGIAGLDRQLPAPGRPGGRRSAASRPAGSARRSHASDGIRIFKVTAVQTRLPDASPDRDAQDRRLQQLVPGREGGSEADHDRAAGQHVERHLTAGDAGRAPRRGAAALGPRPRRWSRGDPAERLVGVPLEPTRPVALVPLAALRAAGARPCRHRRSPAGTAPAGMTRSRSSGASTRADHPVGRFGAPGGTTVGALSAGRPGRRRSTSPPVAPEPPSPRPGGCPGSPTGCGRPDGCPWDREQTHESLRNHLLEEAYEVYDALADGATPALAGELGDLWLQVVLHAQLAAEAGVFDLADVQAAIASKIVRRHPHVFGDAEARTATDVNRQWERIKQAERAAEAAAAAVPGGDPPAPARRARSHGISRSHARARGEPGDAGARRPPRLRLAERRRGPGQGGRGARASSPRPSSPAERAEEVGDLLMVAREPGAAPWRRRGGGAPRREREVPAALRDRGAPGGRAGRRPARPLVRRARRALGPGEGGAGRPATAADHAPATPRERRAGVHRRGGDHDDREPRAGRAPVRAAARRAARRELHPRRR